MLSVFSHWNSLTCFQGGKAERILEMICIPYAIQNTVHMDQSLGLG